MNLRKQKYKKSFTGLRFQKSSYYAYFLSKQTKNSLYYWFFQYKHLIYFNLIVMLKKKVKNNN